MISESQYDDFSSIIRHNVLSFLDRHFVFMRDDYPVILQYFSGLTDSISDKLITSLSNLENEASIIISKASSVRFEETLYVDIFYLIEDIRESFTLIRNLFKFLRSERTNFNYSNTLEINRITAKGETLEKIVNDVDSTDPQNDWVGVALRNDLSENDFSLSGGQNVILSISLDLPDVKAQSVLGSALGLRILGLDVSREITFSDNDLLTLDFENTYEQSATILINLRKGDIPEFLNLGRDRVIGNSLASFAFANFARQFTNVFSTDDSFSSIQVKDVSFEGTDVNLVVEVSGRIENSSSTITINSPI